MSEPTVQTTTPVPQPAPPEEDPESTRTILRSALGFVANVTVLTALLVYFGWRRSETQSAELGIASSVLDMSTQDYLLRSVRPVLVLLVGVAVTGLAWVLLDRWLVGLIRRNGPRTPHGRGWARWVLRALAVASVLLPAAVYVIGFGWPALAFVLFPASIGIGALLLLYVAHLRRTDPTPDEATGNRTFALRASCGMLVGVCLFWTAANYAHLEGVQLANGITENIERLPGVTIYSDRQLHLDGPGIEEKELSQGVNELRYRYTGLRLLEHTGGKCFLVSDRWTRTYGVLFVVRDDDHSMRLDFVHDQR